jgi:hypothetical protein
VLGLGNRVWGLESGVRDLGLHRMCQGLYSKVHILAGFSVLIPRSCLVFDSFDTDTDTDRGIDTDTGAATRHRYRHRYRHRHRNRQRQKTDSCDTCLSFDIALRAVLSRWLR